MAHTAPAAAGSGTSSSLLPSFPQLHKCWSEIGHATTHATLAVCRCPLQEDDVTASHILLSSTLVLPVYVRGHVCGWCFLCETQISNIATGSVCKGYRRLRNSTKRTKAAELERTEVTHAAECFQMSHSRTGGGAEWSSVGESFQIICWYHLMSVQNGCAVIPRWKIFVRKWILKKRRRPGCIFQLPASPPPSQSLFYKSVSSLHSHVDTATPSTLIACYSPLLKSQHAARHGFAPRSIFSKVAFGSPSFFFFPLSLLSQNHINTEEVTNKSRQWRQSSRVSVSEVTAQINASVHWLYLCIDALVWK